MGNVTGYEEPQTYYDESTGATLWIADSERYEVRKKRTKKEEEPNGYFKTRGNTGYVNCYHDPVQSLNDKLKIHELGALLKLLPHMSRKHGGGLIKDKKLMGVNEIALVIKKNRRMTMYIIAALTDAGVLISEREGRRNVYGINPLYHSFGSDIDARRYTKLYQFKTRISIEEVSLQAAGLLYKTLPFFHYSRYYLCANPNERQGGLIQHLTQDELAELINEDPSVVSRHMQELSRAGFVMRCEAFGNIVIKVNPEVMYRKKVLDDKALQLIDDFAEIQNAHTWRITTDELPF